MRQLNIRVSDELYWKFLEQKAKLKAETIEETLQKLLEMAEETEEAEK